MIPGKTLLLAAEGLAVGHEKTLVSDISLEIGPGECILLCGPNGSGKSTLLHTFADMLPPLSGRLQTSAVALIPARIPKISGFTLSEFIRISMYRHSSWNGRLAKNAEKALDTALRLLDIGPLADRDIATLSDGEFQRGCIATALVRILLSEKQGERKGLPATQADAGGLILLDEPTAYLDVEGRIQVLRLLRDIVRETGTAVLFSSHELTESVSIATRILGITRDGHLLDARPEESAGLFKTCFPTFQRNNP